jgi:serine/threonine-protein kinase
MAELFLGKEPTGRPVVIKRILPHLARQTSFVSMFIDEARIGSRAKHPNLVEVHELGQVGTDLFLVMEYLVGENLAGLVRRLTKRQERMSYGLCAYIIAEVCDGLHAAHELKDESGTPLDLVHRDVSPQNVFITYGGDVKLLDFGVATAAHRLTQTASGEVKGKYAYMSPEQCKGEPLDRRSDIFSLGIVLYELTTLRRLFKRTNELQVMKAITEEPIPRPTREVAEYPKCLEDICVRALARDPRQRYATAAEMRDDLLRAMQELGLEGDPHEAIASKLARLFADRMAQKRELLDRVRGGGDLSDLLVPEVDEQVDVPLVGKAETSSLSRVRRAVAKGSKKRAVIATAFAIAILGGAGVGAMMRLRDKQPPTAAVVITPVDAAAQEDIEIDEPPPAPPEQQFVVISVDTEPSGVKVRLDGEERGATPLDIKLAKSEKPMKLELLSPGFATGGQQVIADRDQRLSFSLIKTEKTIVRIKRPPPPRQSPPKKKEDKGSGFHRFD